MISTSPSDVSRNTWLSHLPTSWKIIPFKRLFEFVGSSSPLEDLPVLSLTRNGIVERDVSNNEGQLAADYSEHPVLEIGDFALNPMDLVGGWVARSSLRGRISGAYFLFRLRREALSSGMSPAYFEMLLQSYYTRQIFNPFGAGVGRSENGGGRWTLSSQTLEVFPIPVPPVAEQEAIVQEIGSVVWGIRELIIAQKNMLSALDSHEKAVVSQRILGEESLN